MCTVWDHESDNLFTVTILTKHHRRGPILPGVLRRNGCWPVVDSSSRLVGGSSALLLTELLPGAEEAMALRITRNTKINAENKAKISMAGAKRVPVASVATSKPGLRPRTALGDIGNKVSEQPQAKLPLKKV